MSCGCRSSSCSSSNCSCSNCSPCEPECATVCSALTISNSWNVPACFSSAVLSVPGLTTVLIGAYIWNPTYGWFRITGFDSVNGQLTIYNECITGNATAGTVVPSDTQFVFGAPPANTNVVYVAYANGTPYNLTTISAALTYGSANPIITITQPGTYRIFAQVEFVAFGLTTLGNSINMDMRRTNNTPGVLANSGFSIQAPPAVTSFSGLIARVGLPVVFYGTFNTNDMVTIFANYIGAIGAGNIQAESSSIEAVKLF